MPQIDTEQVAEDGYKYFGRALAVLGGIMVAFVLYGLIYAQLGGFGSGGLLGAVILAAATLVIWNYCQRDNRRAEAAGDKALIVTTFYQDVGGTAFGVIVVGFILILLQFVDLAGAIAAPLGTAAGYFFWQLIWRQLK